MKHLDKSSIQQALDYQYALLEKHQKNLQILEISAANYSPHDVPLHITNQIHEIKDAIAKIKQDISILQELLGAIDADESVHKQPEPDVPKSAPKERKGRGFWILVSGIFTAIAIACSGFSGSISSTIDETFVENPGRFPNFTIPFVCPSAGVNLSNTSVYKGDIELVVFADTNTEAEIYSYGRSKYIVSSTISERSCRQSNLEVGSYSLITSPVIKDWPEGFDFTVTSNEKIIIIIKQGKIIIKSFP